MALIKDTAFRPSRKQRTRDPAISRRVLQYLQCGQFRFALQHRPRQRLRHHQQDRRPIAPDPVLPKSDLLTLSPPHTILIGMIVPVPIPLRPPRFSVEFSLPASEGA